MLVPHDIMKMFNDLLKGKISSSHRSYKEHVSNDIIKAIRDGNGIVIISMPTRSSSHLEDIH